MTHHVYDTKKKVNLSNIYRKPNEIFYISYNNLPQGSFNISDINTMYTGNTRQYKLLCMLLKNKSYNIELFENTYVSDRLQNLHDMEIYHITHDEQVQSAELLVLDSRTYYLDKSLDDILQVECICKSHVSPVVTVLAAEMLAEINKRNGKNHDFIYTPSIPFITYVNDNYISQSKEDLRFEN